MVVKLEVLHGEVPCAEYMKVVAVTEDCKGCDYNMRRGHPDRSDLKQDAKGDSEPVCVECGSLHPRGPKEAAEYQSIARKFYGLKEELPEKPKQEAEPKGPPHFRDTKHPWDS